MDELVDSIKKLTREWLKTQPKLPEWYVCSKDAQANPELKEAIRELLQSFGRWYIIKEFENNLHVIEKLLEDDLTKRPAMLLNSWFNDPEFSYPINDKARKFLEHELKTNSGLKELVNLSRERYMSLNVDSIYRGLSLDSINKTVIGQSISIPFSSWTTDINTVKEYCTSSNIGVIYKIPGISIDKIAVSDVFIKKYIYMLNENEFLLFSGKYEILNSVYNEIYGTKVNVVTLKEIF